MRFLLALTLLLFSSLAWGQQVGGPMIPSGGVGTALSIVGAKTGCSSVGDVLYSSGSPGVVACNSGFTYDGTSAIGGLSTGINVTTELRMVDNAAVVTLFGCNHVDPTKRCYASDIPGDTDNRFSITGNGLIQWGSGAASRDTSLSRINDGTLYLNGPAGISSLEIGTQSGFHVAGYGSLAINGPTGSFMQLFSGDVEILRWQVLGLSAVITQGATTTGGIQWLTPTSAIQALYYSSGGIYFGATPSDPGANNVTVQGTFKAGAVAATIAAPNSSTGTLTIDTGTQVKSNSAIFGNDSIVIKNAAHSLGTMQLINPGDTTQPSASSLLIRGGSDGSQLFFTNTGLIYPADYVAATTYSKGQVVNCAASACSAANGFAYTSQTNSNVGHDPSTDGGTNWKTNSNASVNGIYIYQEPLLNWNGMETGIAGLQLWIGPKSTGNIGGEQETPVGAFMLTAWDDTNHIPITTMSSKTTFTKELDVTLAEGPAIVSHITTGNVNGYVFQGQTASGGIIAMFSNVSAGWFGTRNAFPMYFFTNDANPSMIMYVSGGLYLGAFANATDPGASNLYVRGTATIFGMASAATTSAVCYNMTTGLLTFDGTLGTCQVSTARVKHDIKPLQVDPLNAVMRMRPVEFFYNDDQNTPGQQVGLIAEELAAIDDRLVGRDDTGQPNSIRFLGPMNAYLIGAVQSLKREFDGYKRAHP